MARQAEPRGQGDERNRRARNAGGEGPSSSALPPHLEEQRTRVLCDMDAPKNVRRNRGYLPTAGKTAWNEGGYLDEEKSRILC